MSVRKGAFTGVVSGIACAAACAVLFAGAALAQEAGRDDIIRHFDLALKYYEMGEADNAVKELNQVLALKPGPGLALYLREKVGMDQLAKMLRDDRYGDQIHQILQLAQEEAKRRRRDEKYIEQLKRLLASSDVRERWEAIFKLAAVGEFAVPYLLEGLEDPNLGVPGDISIPAQIAIDQMGRRAALPLIEACRATNPLVAAYACDALGKIGDRRAVPALARLVQGGAQSPTVLEAAKKAVTAITGALAADLAPADRYYFEVAEGYYYANPAYVDYVQDLQFVIWNWNPEGKSLHEQIVWKEVPEYAYNELMAERDIFRGLEINPANEELLGLLAADYFAQQYEAEELSKSRPADRTRPTAELKAEAEARAKRLAVAPLIAEALGSNVLDLALLRALDESRPRFGSAAIALRCIAAFRADADPRLPTVPAERKSAEGGAQAAPKTGKAPPAETAPRRAPVSPSQFGLIVALNSPHAAARFHAAEAILHIAPSGSLGGEDLVIRRVIQVLGQRAVKNILVISPDNDLRSTLRAELEEHNFLTEGAVTAQDGLAIARQLVPVVDLIVLDSNVLGLSLSDMMHALTADARTMRTPIVLYAGETEKDPLSKQYAGQLAAAVAKTERKGALAKAVGQVLGRPEYRLIQANEAAALIQRVIVTLAGIDPSTTSYPVERLTPVVIPLIGPQYAAAVRLSALAVLGRLADDAARESVRALAFEPKTDKELRTAAFDALEAIISANRRISDSERGEFIKLLRDADADVRHAAARILAKSGLSAPQAADIAREMRIGL